MSKKKTYRVVVRLGGSRWKWAKAWILGHCNYFTDEVEEVQ